jgi:acyl-coenzyme A thioesterase 13
MKHNLHRLTDLSLSIEGRMQALLSSVVDDPEYMGFDNLSLGGVEFISANQETQSVRYAFTVLQTLCNKGGNLHGGAATTLFDTLTTSALLTIAKPGFWDMLGVSRTLTVTFLRPVPLGTKVFVDCAVVAAGKKLSNLRGTMTTSDGKVCVTCVHDKAAVETPRL